ncbi:hypothetical protein BGW80DRAFT_1250624 [Lactifluus volemus]|nr:hypothetical protein BGW80DRAFT_1250624 [Lactifluus volemus]
MVGSNVLSYTLMAILVEFANAPKKDKAMLERLFTVERNAYHKLASAHLTGWVAPHFYGEYRDEWYGLRKCEELRYAWSDQLWPDLDTFEFILNNGITGMLRKVGLVAVIGGCLLLYLLAHIFSIL